VLTAFLATNLFRRTLDGVVWATGNNK